MTAVKERRAGSASAEPAPKRRTGLIGVLLVGVVGVVALGWWGLSGRGSVVPVEVGEAVGIPGGLMVVSDVRPEVMVHDMAPGMTMPDPIPEGYRRFAVDIVFRAGEGGTTIYPGDLYVEGDGLGPTPPHRVAGTVSPLAEGSSLALSVLFQVPSDSETLWLGYGDGSEVVALEGDVGDGHDHDGHDHGDHDHGDEQLVADVVIGIDDGRFEQPTLTVAAGTTVGWENADGQVPHTVTFADGGPDSGVLQAGETFSVHLDFAGTYSYVCEIHPSMRGRIVVEGG